MQITIRFDKALNKSMDIFSAVHKVCKRYNERVYLIGGNMGLNVSNVSWDQCYEIAEWTIKIIRREGALSIDGIKICIFEDYRTSEVP